MRDPLLFGLGAAHDQVIERQVQAIFYALIFGPLADILRKETAQAKGLRLSNAPTTALLEALRSGRVQYDMGVFTGKFSGAISSALLDLGAKFDRRGPAFRLSPAQVPAWIVAEASAYTSKAKGAHDLLIRSLDDAQENFAKGLETKLVDATLAIGELASGWTSAAKALQVNPQLNQTSLDRLKRKYDDNTKLAIKDWADEEIPKLRGIVRDNAAQGYRFDRLIPAIEARYGVSQGKAKFLAAQETTLLVSKFREERFKEVGVTKYTWMTSHDRRVRDDHKALDGQTFSYGSPPVTNKATGARNNPGEDFGCRCVARPVLSAERLERVAA